MKNLNDFLYDFRCEPRSQDETPGGPEESGWNKSRHMYIRICVQSTHMYVYAKGGMRSWTNSFFL